MKMINRTLDEKIKPKLAPIDVAFESDSGNQEGPADPVTENPYHSLSPK